MATRMAYHEVSFDGGPGIHGKASTKEERPKRAVEEPISDYSCSNSIVAAIHMVFYGFLYGVPRVSIKSTCSSRIWLEH